MPRKLPKIDIVCGLPGTIPAGRQEPAFAVGPLRGAGQKRCAAVGTASGTAEQRADSSAVRSARRPSLRIMTRLPADLFLGKLFGGHADGEMERGWRTSGEG